MACGMRFHPICLQLNVQRFSSTSSRAVQSTLLALSAGYFAGCSPDRVMLDHLWHICNVLRKEIGYFVATLPPSYAATQIRAWLAKRIMTLAVLFAAHRRGTAAVAFLPVL